MKLQFITTIILLGSLLPIAVQAANCQGQAVTCWHHDTQAHHTHPNADSCSTYWDHALQQHMTYAYCSEPTAPVVAGCQGETVTCWHHETQSHQTHRNADSCSSYWDHVTQQHITYSYCSK